MPGRTARPRPRRRIRSVRRRLSRCALRLAPGRAAAIRGSRPDRADAGGRRAARARRDRLHRRAGRADALPHHRARSTARSAAAGSRGLTLPLTGRFGRGGFALGEGCVDRRLPGAAGPEPAARAVAAAALPGRARADRRTAGSAAELRAPRFAGRLGSSPITLAADRLRVDSAGFAAARARGAARPGRRVNRLDVASLTGRFGAARRRRAASRACRAISPTCRCWSATGSGTLADARRRPRARRPADRRRPAEPARFTPLASEDFRLDPRRQPHPRHRHARPSGERHAGRAGHDRARPRQRRRRCRARRARAALRRRASSPRR